LINLLHANETAKRQVSSDNIDTFISTMLREKENEEIQWSCCIIIIQLSKLAQHRESFGYKGAIFSVLNVFNQYKDNERIISVASYALYMMCITPDNATYLNETHITTLTEIMEKFSYSEYIIFPLIKLLARVAKDGNREVIKVDEWINICDSAINNHSGQIKHFAILLMNFLQNIENISDDSRSDDEQSTDSGSGSNENKSSDDNTSDDNTSDDKEDNKKK